MFARCAKREKLNLKVFRQINFTIFGNRSAKIKRAESTKNLLQAQFQNQKTKIFLTVFAIVQTKITAIRLEINTLYVLALYVCRNYSGRHYAKTFFDYKVLFFIFKSMFF